MLPRVEFSLAGLGFLMCGIALKWAIREQSIHYLHGSRKGGNECETAKRWSGGGARVIIGMKGNSALKLQSSCSPNALPIPMES